MAACMLLLIGLALFLHTRCFCLALILYVTSMCSYRTPLNNNALSYTVLLKGNVAINYIIRKSRQKGLITKEHIATHTHLNFRVLYFNTLIMTLFNSNTKFLKLKLLL